MKSNDTQNYWFLIFLTSTFYAYTSIPIALGLSMGAPTKSCSDMKPVHKDTVPQVSNSPYKIELTYPNRNKILKPDEKLQIKLTSPGNTRAFQGFLIQVRDEQDGLFGTFEIDKTSDTSFLSCSKGKGNTAVTHKAPTDKYSVSVKWRAPKKPTKKQMNNNVVFTVAANRTVYWVKKKMSFKLTAGASNTNISECPYQLLIMPILLQFWKLMTH